MTKTDMTLRGDYSDYCTEVDTQSQMQSTKVRDFVADTKELEVQCSTSTTVGFMLHKESRKSKLELIYTKESYT